jgi:hypothetical protein
VVCVKAFSSDVFKKLPVVCIYFVFKNRRLSVLSPVYFMLSGLYGLSPVNRKHFGSSAIICKPVTNFPLRLHLAKPQI